MRHSCLLFLCLSVYVVSETVGSYDAAYAAPEVHTAYAGHGAGHSAGSYYHYHVPVVGQQQPHYHEPHHHHQPNNELHYILPLLLLLGGLPLLLFSLLPLLLLPIGLSLLALLMPGGMMMMMMMMEMMEMMSPARIRSLPLRKTGEAMRSLDVNALKDVTEFAYNFTRSMDVECPEKFACELGAVFSLVNSSKGGTAETILNYIIDQIMPKGTARKNLRLYRSSFRKGSNDANNCSVYNCKSKLHSMQSQQDHGYSVTDI